MHQIKAYHRPNSVEEALKLLARPGVKTALIAGGTYAVPRLPETVEEVVDLQNIKALTRIEHYARQMTIGAMVRLQRLVDDEQAPTVLRQAARREGPNTFRNVGTIGGVIATGDRDSELLAALLVFDAQVEVQTIGGSKKIPLQTFLRDIPAALAGGVITAVTVATTGIAAAERVARTPADTPIVAAVARKDENGEIRLALCGVDAAPVLVDPDNVKAGITPPDDFRGSREYRRQMAAVLSRRVLQALEQK